MKDYSIYMFSDGTWTSLADPRGKKFMSKNFKKLILEMQTLPLEEQGAAMEKGSDRLDGRNQSDR